MERERLSGVCVRRPLVVPSTRALRLWPRRCPRAAVSSGIRGSAPAGRGRSSQGTPRALPHQDAMAANNRGEASAGHESTPIVVLPIDDRATAQTLLAALPAEEQAGKCGRAVAGLVAGEHTVATAYGATWSQSCFSLACRVLASPWCTTACLEYVVWLVKGMFAWLWLRRLCGVDA